MTDLLSTSDHALLAGGFCLAGWTVRPRAHELERGGEALRIEPKPMGVLVCLAARAGHTVTRGELLDAVWPDVYVSESTLSRCVSQLRKAFGDDPQAPTVIETIPKAGYRLLARVTPLTTGDGLARAHTAEVAVTMPAPPPTPAPKAPPPRAERAPTRRWTSRYIPLAALGLFVALALGVAVAVGAWVLGSEARLLGSGSTATVLPFDLEPGSATSAAWNPAGTQLAYVRTNWAAEAPPTSALLVRASADAAPLELDGGRVRLGTPAWAPDGTEVGYIRCDSAGCTPHAVAALGGTPRRLVDVPTAPLGLAWIEGALIVGQRDAPAAPWYLARVDLASGQAVRLTAPEATSRGDGMPQVSPDGRWLAFERHTAAGGQDLYRLDLASPGTEPIRLTRDDADIAGHTWTPDGASLVFSSNRSGVYALWRLDPATGAVQRVATVPARDPGGPALAGDALVFEEWLFEINLWRHDVAGDSASSERIVASTLWDMHPHLSHDGQLALVSNRSGTPEVWLADAEGAALRRLTFFEGPAVESPQWHPDGERLVVQARQDTRAVLMLLDAAGGPPTPLTDAVADARHPRWTPEGRAVLFASNRGGAWHLWRVAAEGGTPERVPGTEGAVVGAALADGSILLARYGERGLWHLAEGEATRLDVSDLADPLAWTVAGSAVVYLAATDAGRQVVRWLPATGQRTALPVQPGSALPRAPMLTASADGKTVVVAQIDQVESDLMLARGIE